MRIHGAHLTTGAVDSGRAELIRMLRPSEKVRDRSAEIARALGFSGYASFVAVRAWLWQRYRGASPLAAWREARAAGAAAAIRSAL